MNFKGKLPPGVPTPQEAVAQLRQQAEDSFQAFLQSPSIKLLISMVPPTNPPEVLHTLLHTAWMTAAQMGVLSGSAQVITAVVGIMFDEKDGGDRAGS